MTGRAEENELAKLHSLVAQVLPTLEPAGPLPILPPNGDDADLQAWYNEVAIRRARHDSAALDAQSAYDELLRAALGPDPLGAAAAGLRPEWAEIPVRDGAIGARLYRPSGEGPFPVVLLLHGGAYWMGGGAAGWRMNDAVCRLIAARVGALVVNVDYRLAPESQHPVPVDDAVEAMRWVLAHAHRLDADAGRLALFGISSGGNLAAAAAARSVDGHAPELAALVLQCPSVNLSLESSRYVASASEFEQARHLIALYTGGSDPADPDVSPVLRASFAGMPPTLLITADEDPLTFDTQEYGDRLETDGVRVTRHPYPMTHTVATPEVFARMHGETCSWLRAELGG